MLGGEGKSLKGIHISILVNLTCCLITLAGFVNISKFGSGSFFSSFISSTSLSVSSFFSFSLSFWESLDVSFEDVSFEDTSLEEDVSFDSLLVDALSVSFFSSS